MLVTCARTERPHGALLQFDTGIRHGMYRIGGRLRRYDVSCTGVAVGIPPLPCWISPGVSLRQCPNHYAFRAGRNLPDKEFRYLRTVIVTAAVYWGLSSKLRLR